jgi:hypothetical protein
MGPEKIKWDAMKDEVQRAFHVLRKAMVDDEPEKPGSYAHSWHCNIAMMCHDVLRGYGLDSDTAHRLGNDTASRFMKLCFDVKTKA